MKVNTPPPLQTVTPRAQATQRPRTARLPLVSEHTNCISSPKDIAEILASVLRVEVNDHDKFALLCYQDDVCYKNQLILYVQNEPLRLRPNQVRDFVEEKVRNEFQAEVLGKLMEYAGTNILNETKEIVLGRCSHYRDDLLEAMIALSMALGDAKHFRLLRKVFQVVIELGNN